MHTEQLKQPLIWNQRKIHMTQIRTMSEIPETFEGLGQTFVKYIPSGYIAVDIVADTYRSGYSS